MACVWYAYNCLHMCRYIVCVLCMHMCTHVWRPKVDFWCLPQLLLTVFIEERSLPKAKTLQFWQWLFFVFRGSVSMIGCYCACLAFYVDSEFSGYKFWLSRLPCKWFTYWAIPQPHFIFLQEHLIRDLCQHCFTHNIVYCWLPSWCYAAIMCSNLAWLKLYNFWPHFLLLSVVATHHSTPRFCGIVDLRNL